VSVCVSLEQALATTIEAQRRAEWERAPPPQGRHGQEHGEGGGDEGNEAEGRRDAGRREEERGDARGRGGRGRRREGGEGGEGGRGGGALGGLKSLVSRLYHAVSSIGVRAHSCPESAYTLNPEPELKTYRGTSLIRNCPPPPRTTIGP